tara:strand:+ start:2403 stop:3743 length:1341 start_codon:yes stop_codon:yes gene_type:complete
MKKVHFLGIGGIGMSALAKWAVFNGYVVSGYDREESKITDELVDKGINIFFNHDYIDNLILDGFADFIVYSSAFKFDHPILVFFLKYNFPIFKRADFLSQIASSYNVIAIAGTHGKTTISCMLSHILKHSGIDCNAFLGGISKNYNTNILIGDSNLMIIEADEYDRSFLSLNPFIGLVSSVDKDHVDTYNTYEDMLFAYNKFIKKCQNIIIHEGVRNKLQGPKITNTIFYSFSNENALGYSLKNNHNISHTNFSVMNNNELLFSLEFPSIPKYNIENFLAAISIALELNVKYDNIIDSIRSFKGVDRRFEYHIKNDHLTLIEDYAHHPVELKRLIENVSFLHPEKKITLIFQPHLFSRTKDFLSEFSSILSNVHRLILLDIYAAREKPMNDFSINDLFSRINLSNKIILCKKDICKYLLDFDCDLIVVAGAGDICNIIPDLKKHFS